MKNGVIRKSPSMIIVNLNSKINLSITKTKAIFPLSRGTMMQEGFNINAFAFYKSPL